ncbi:MAG: hypothetical protein KAS67_06040 [Thermoplasmata archaeon]|nr:hypothetical protein [Thermoplasmata archaeon]
MAGFVEVDSAVGMTHVAVVQEAEVDLALVEAVDFLALEVYIYSFLYIHSFLSLRNEKDYELFNA